MNKLTPEQRDWILLSFSAGKDYREQLTEDMAYTRLLNILTFNTAEDEVSYCLGIFSECLCDECEERRTQIALRKIEECKKHWREVLHYETIVPGADDIIDWLQEDKCQN